MSFNQLLKKYNLPILGEEVESEMDQLERLAALEQKLNIKRHGSNEREPEGNDDGK
jgi:hypothetical protein